MPSFQLCRSTGQNVKPDTIWQSTLQRQLGVTMYCGSYVVNLFKHAMMRLQFAHVRSFACRSKFAKLAGGLFCCWSLLRDNNTAINTQTFTSCRVAGVFRM